MVPGPSLYLANSLFVTIIERNFYDLEKTTKRTILYRNLIYYSKKLYCRNPGVGSASQIQTQNKKALSLSI